MATLHLPHIGNPAPVLEPSDLRPVRSLCPFCNGPRTLLTYPMPTEGNVDTSHMLDLVADYRPYFGHAAGSRGCNSCEVRLAARRAVPPPPGRAVVDPTQALVDQLQQHADAIFPKPKATPVVPPQVVTHAALAALARCNVPGFDPTIGGAYERGRPFVAPLLARMEAGDFGLVGQASEGDPKAGTTRGPLAERIDRNVAALADGRGVVRAVFPVVQIGTREESTRDKAGVWIKKTVPTGEEVFRANIVIDTIVGPDPLIFVHLPGEGD